MVIWQLRSGSVARQSPALKAIAATFVILAAYVSFEAVRDLITADKAGESLIGIILNGVALTVMVPVALAQGRTGRGLDNPVLSGPVQGNLAVRLPPSPCSPAWPSTAPSADGGPTPSPASPSQR